ncbi:Multicopper oxidase [Nocardia amikacinitolerans]|nr:multicopper oxidase domain-containing protein [Nocardia amikacinitolerans]MCP2293280.1 Multicopper oxidase [Nocardia amikacinitolerans]
MLGALGVTAGGPAAAEIFPLPPAPLPLPPLPPLPITPFNYHSPPLEPFADPLPIPETRPAAGELVATSGVHRYHRDLPETRTWGFSRPVLGPTLEAHRGSPAHITFRNELGPHVLAAHVDTGMHATTDLDRTDPRMTVHLHGAHNHPDFDGHPLITWRNGGRIRNWYGNRQQAITLWYHDHAMGITRLNLQAGLAGMYYLRDEFDTGAPDNPLGLPTGEYEIPLIVQDRTFNPDGSLQPMVGTYIAQGYNQSGQFGDVACVNGVAWPSLPVRRTLYRFRQHGLHGSGAAPYHAVHRRRGRSGRGRARPAAGRRRAARTAGAARRPAVDPDHDDDGPDRHAATPLRLHPACAEQPAVPHHRCRRRESGHRRTMGSDQRHPLRPPDPPAPGPDAHPRQATDPHRGLLAGQPSRTTLGHAVESARRCLRPGPPAATPTVGTGWKDTVLCPTDAITRVLVYWPSTDELGFDPDTPLRVRDGAEAIAPYGDPTPQHHTNHTDATTVRGYVWHCHNLDHEDHDMMQQIRITA